MPVIRTRNATSAFDDEEDDQQDEEEDDQQEDEEDLDNADDVSKESAKVDFEDKDITMEESTRSRLAAEEAGPVTHRSFGLTPAQPTLNALTTITSNLTQDNVTAEKSAKRIQSDTIPAPPSPKRARLETIPQPKVPTQEVGLTTSMASATLEISNEPRTVLQSTASTVAGPTSLSAPRTEPSADDADSGDDDDDFGALVLGQDSDDED